MTPRFPSCFLWNNFPCQRSCGAWFGLNSIAFPLALSGFVWHLDVHRMSMREEILEVGYSDFILLVRTTRARSNEGLALSLRQLALPPGLCLGVWLSFFPLDCEQLGDRYCFTYLYTPCDALYRGFHAVDTQSISIEWILLNEYLVGMNFAGHWTQTWKEYTAFYGTQFSVSLELPLSCKEENLILPIGG